MDPSNKPGNLSDETLVQKSTEKNEGKKPVFCTYCSELASGYNSQGMPMCGVSVDHPNYDNEITEPL